MEKRTLITLGILLLILCTIIGGVLGVVEHNYKIQKCERMTSTASNYDFDNKIELNAKFNENCYYIKNHPLAKFGYVAFGIAMGILVAVMINFVVILIGYSIKIERERELI